MKKNNKPLSETREWQPSASQVKMVELLLNPDDRRTKSEKIAEVGIARQTFYGWMKDKRFTDYLDAQIELYTNGEIFEIWKALVNAAKRGNVAAIKLFFDMMKISPDFLLTEETARVRLAIERERLELEKKKVNNGEASAADLNEVVKVGLLGLFDMLKNPAPNRSIEQIEAEGGVR